VPCLFDVGDIEIGEALEPLRVADPRLVVGEVETGNEARSTDELEQIVAVRGYRYSLGSSSPATRAVCQQRRSRPRRASRRRDAGFSDPTESASQPEQRRQCAGAPAEPTTGADDRRLHLRRRDEAFEYQRMVDIEEVFVFTGAQPGPFEGGSRWQTACGFIDACQATSEQGASELPRRRAGARRAARPSGSSAPKRGRHWRREGERGSSQHPGFRSGSPPTGRRKSSRRGGRESRRSSMNRFTPFR
jgi:hypothetical protein